MSRAKSHHLVPRHYLARFARDGKVMAVRFGGTCGLESIRRAATVSEFYTTRGADGEPVDVVEQWLSNVESMLHPAFTAFESRRWPLDSPDRERMALWVAVQYLRTQMIREISTSIGQLVVDEELSPAARATWTEQQVSKHPDSDADHVRAIAAAALADAASRLRSRAASAAWHADAIERYARPIAGDLLSRRWLIFRFERRALATSDDPVGLQAAHPGPVGIRTARAVTFPVDRHTGLVMLDEPGSDEDRSPTASIARTLNRLTVASARLAIFHHPEDMPLEGLRIPVAPRPRP